jgi:tryptophan-rich sensory protein
MKQLKLTILFLIVNFGGLAIGASLMNNGPISEWYVTLNQAPWTPPGVVFGIAWTFIMILFSIYLGKLFSKEINQKNSILFLFQLILNVSWNFIFFNQHLVLLGLITIVLLTSVLFIYYLKFSTKVGNYRYLLVPYMLWLCIATSLNLYILVHN